MKLFLTDMLFFGATVSGRGAIGRRRDPNAPGLASLIVNVAFSRSFLDSWKHFAMHPFFQPLMDVVYRFEHFGYYRY